MRPSRASRFGVQPVFAAFLPSSRFLWRPQLLTRLAPLPVAEGHPPVHSCSTMAIAHECTQVAQHTFLSYG